MVDGWALWSRLLYAGVSDVVAVIELERGCDSSDVLVVYTRNRKGPRGTVWCRGGIAATN